MHWKNKYVIWNLGVTVTVELQLTVYSKVSYMHEIFRLDG